VAAASSNFPREQRIAMKKLPIDMDYLTSTMLKLLEIPSPSGYTDQVVHFVGQELDALGVPFELTRRGAIRATLAGTVKEPARALVAHVDTLGAMVKGLKANGRVEVMPIGTWSSRFAEGARVTIFTGRDPLRGTILPLKASGHIFNREIDEQPTSWQHVEIRVDARCENAADLKRLNVDVGDFVGIDSGTEMLDNGFVNSRHLDDKAGVACLLAAAKAVVKAKVTLPFDCYLLFTLSEEVGSGASAVLHGHVAEMVAVDNATPGPGQACDEFSVTVCMMDLSGPFDYHLSRKLLQLAGGHDIAAKPDVFRYYRSDAASATEAGSDIRTALMCFGVDASHGYERTHVSALRAVAELASVYVQSPLTFGRDRKDLGPLKGFPTQPM
jgi:peptidase M42 family hydrolase